MRNTNNVENDQFPVKDKELFERMKAEARTANEKEFFERMCYKEQHEFPVSTFDVILSEDDNRDGLYFVKCYYSEYIVGINRPGKRMKLDYIPSSLQDALDVDLFPLLNLHLSLLEWFRKYDYRGVRYDYEWEE